MGITPRLETIFKPGAPLPPDDVMIAKGLEILSFSPHGQQLANMISEHNIELAIMATPQPTTYLPEPRKSYIGFNRVKPVSPSRFVMMLTGLLRSAQQDINGITRPALNAPVEEHKKVGLAKEEDKLWYMCTVAVELDNLDLFTEYKFLDELRNMGYSEIVELYLRQEQKKG